MEQEQPKRKRLSKEELDKAVAKQAAKKPHVWSEMRDAGIGNHPREQDALALAEAAGADSEALTEKLMPSAEQKEDAVEHAPDPERIPESRYTLTSLAEFSEGKPQSYYLKGICPRSGLGQIMGESGSCKTFIALDMAYALAIGRNWFKWTYSHKAKKNLPLVVYLVLEGGGGFRLRVKALLQRERNNPHNGNPEPSNFVLSDRPFDISRHEDRDALVASILERAGERGIVLFVDTMAQAMPGGIDENSSQDMGTLLKYVTELQERLDKISAFVWLISHMGKNGNARKGSRGWSGLKAPMDMQIAVEQDDKTGARFFTIVKNKDGMDGVSCSFTLQGRIVGKDEDGADMESCTVEQAPDIDVKARLTPAQEKALRWLRAAYAQEGKVPGRDAVTMKAWRDACMAETRLDYKDAYNRVDNARKALQEKKLIVCGDNAGSDVMLTDKSEDV